MLKRFILFFIFVAAICVAFYLGSPTLGEKPHEPVWSVVDPQKVDRIDIVVNSGNSFSLIRSASHWNVLIPGWGDSPYANSAKIKELLEVLSTGRPLRYIGRVKNSDLAQYGLDKPKVEIATGGGQVLMIEIGRATPTGDGVFALNSLNPGQLFLLGKNFLALSGENLRSFCDLHLVHGKPENVDSLSMNINSIPNWKIIRKPGGDGYIFQFPASFNNDVTVSTSEMDLLLHSLFGTAAKDLVQNPSGKVVEHVLSVEVGMRDKDVQTINIFKTDNDKNPFIANSTAHYGNFVLDKGHVDQLKKTAFDMRRRNILSLETGKVGSMIIIQGNQTIRVYKSKGVWKSPSQEKKLLGIDMSLWRLNELKFEAESVKSLTDDAQGVMVWEIMDQKGKRLAKVEFLSDPKLPEGQCWLSVGNGTEFYPVSNKLLEDLQGQIPLRK